MKLKAKEKKEQNLIVYMANIMLMIKIKDTSLKTHKVDTLI